MSYIGAVSVEAIFEWGRFDQLPKRNIKAFECARASSSALYRHDRLQHKHLPSWPSTDGQNLLPIYTTRVIDMIYWLWTSNFGTVWFIGLIKTTAISECAVCGRLCTITSADNGSPKVFNSNTRPATHFSWWRAIVCSVRVIFGICPFRRAIQQFNAVAVHGQIPTWSICNSMNKY